MKRNARSVFKLIPALLSVSALSGSLFAQATATQATVNYLSGPNGCTGGPGYTDLPYCTIPNEIPLGSFVPPAIGQSFVDAVFGGTITNLTPPGWEHNYSLPSPVSATNKYMFVRYIANGYLNAIDPHTGQVIYSGLTYSTDMNVWDAYNDDIYYRINGTQIVKHQLSTNTDTVLVDYAQDGHGFTAITSGGSTETSKDNWVSFWAQNEGYVCALDLNAVKTYCANYMDPTVVSQVGFDIIDYSMITKGVDSVTGKRYVLMMAKPALGMWSVNLQTGALDFETRGPANPELATTPGTTCVAGENCLDNPHADLFEDTNGQQYMLTYKGYNTPCAMELVTLSLATGPMMYTPVQQGGGRNGFFVLANCGEVWPDLHIGCAKQAPYCVVATYQDIQRNPADLNTPFPVEPHRDEVMMIQGDGQQMTFMAVSRSVQFTNDTYWGQPRAALSPDASMIFFDSNFGVPNAEHAMMMTTGVSATQQADSGAPASTQNPPPAAPAPAAPSGVTITPAALTLSAGQGYQFTANTAVTWSYSPAIGTQYSGGYYLAPANLYASQTVTVTATSVADPTKSANAVVTLTPPAAQTVNITAAPATATLGPGQGTQFVATVLGAQNTAVNWTMNPPVGTLYSGGFYLAPPQIPQPQTITLTATSAADPSKSTSVLVNIQP